MLILLTTIRERERERMQIWGVSPSFKLQSDLNTHARTHTRTHTHACTHAHTHARTHARTHPADIAEVQDSIGY